MQLGRLGVFGAMDTLGVEGAVAFARKLESLGYAALWLPEAVMMDPLVHAAHLLAHTERLVLATGIANIYARDPQASACAANTLAVQSGGRFVLGLGVSHKPFVEDMRGHGYKGPIPTMRAYLEGMEKATYVGPAPAEPPPVVLGALRQKMIALAGEKTQGVHPYLTTPDHTARAREILGPDKWICVEQKVVLEKDPSAAREAGRQSMSVNIALPNYQANLRWLGWEDADFQDGGSDRIVDALIAWGTLADIEKRIQAHFDAGATHVCLQPVRSDGERGPDLEVLEALAPGA